MMQNARRAQATQVNFSFNPETSVLQVSDDGCGIDSIETLFTVAESGWDAEIVAHEHPFGIGFLSALFACRHTFVNLASAGSKFRSIKTNAFERCISGNAVSTICLAFLVTERLGGFFHGATFHISAIVVTSA